MPVDPEVHDACQRGVGRFEEIGCTVTPLDLDLPDLGPAQQTIVLCEVAASCQPRRAEWEQVMFPATRKMLPNADRLTYHDLLAAQWAREEYWEQISGVFEDYDALLTVTSPVTAPANGTLGPKTIAGQSVPHAFVVWGTSCRPT